MFNPFLKILFPLCCQAFPWPGCNIPHQKVLLMGFLHCTKETTKISWDLEGIWVKTLKKKWEEVLKVQFITSVISPHCLLHSFCSSSENLKKSHWDSWEKASGVRTADSLAHELCVFPCPKIWPKELLARSIHIERVLFLLISLSADLTIFSQVRLVRLPPERARAPDAPGTFPWALVGSGSSLPQWEVAAPADFTELWFPEVRPAALKGILWVRKRAIVISCTWKVERRQFHVLVYF